MDALAFLEERGAVRRGLTLFRNGLVSDGWIEKGEVFRDPVALDVLAAAQSQAIAGAFPTATLITGLPAYGAVLASAIGRHLGLLVAFPLLQTPPLWHRMHVPPPGHQVVQVDDLICTGTDTCAALAFLRASGLHVLGVSAWISRISLPNEQLHTLASAPFANYAAEGHSFGGEPIYTDIRE
ncbi:hypothetical protein [Deinococcus frigens]|uniref:hypothetical protein n=1 Tax=Deinococcus frigens TaxID=249403 RepID=UPI00049786A3|nr:hypothetical protein [Deinococcus frigens]